jgi:uncharacterized protein (DUF1778 family)
MPRADEPLAQEPRSEMAWARVAPSELLLFKTAAEAANTTVSDLIREATIPFALEVIRAAREQREADHA